MFQRRRGLGIDDWMSFELSFSTSHQFMILVCCLSEVERVEILTFKMTASRFNSKYTIG